MHPPSVNPSAAIFSEADVSARAASAAADSGSADDEGGHPLKGVLFMPLKALRPSGTHPEHIGELLGVRRKRLASKGLRANAKLLDVIEAGGLIEAARWITYMRTIFIGKKSSPEPRTLKVGEVLRAASARRLLHAGASELRRTLVGIRQWGIILPGGCESLIHWRTTIEQAARDGIDDPVVVADLDLKNYFNTVEWPDIRASLQRHFDRASATVDWEQREPGVTLLPDGTPFKFNQGAEQGEPLGPIKAALPLGDAVG